MGTSCRGEDVRLQGEGDVSSTGRRICGACTLRRAAAPRQARSGHSAGMRLEPLPDVLGERFRTDAARAAGVTAGRLGRADLHRPFRGVRVRRDALLPSELAGAGDVDHAHLERMLAFAPLLTPREFFSHVTAAVLWRLPLPPYLVAAAPVHVSVLAPHRPPRTAGVVGHQAMPKLTGVQLHPATGLPVTSPVTTWAMLASVLTDVRDLVAVGDALIRTWRTEHPMAGIDDVEGAIRQGRRVGIERLREALPLIRDRAASRPETWARLILLDAGLEEPELNVDIRVAGVHEACVDLAYPRQRTAIEYEGEHHLTDPEQWAHDIARYERLASAGWRVVRVTRTELFGAPERFVRRVRAALTATT